MDTADDEANKLIQDITAFSKQIRFRNIILGSSIGMVLIGLLILGYVYFRDNRMVHSERLGLTIYASVSYLSALLLAASACYQQKGYRRNQLEICIKLEEIQRRHNLLYRRLSRLNVAQRKAPKQNHSTTSLSALANTLFEPVDEDDNIVEFSKLTDDSPSMASSNSTLASSDRSLKDTLKRIRKTKLSRPSAAKVDQETDLGQTRVSNIERTLALLRSTSFYAYKDPKRYKGKKNSSHRKHRKKKSNH